MSNLELINNSLAELEQELEKIKTAKELINAMQTSAKLTIDEAQKAVQNFKEITEKLMSESKKVNNETIRKTKELQKNTIELTNSVRELIGKLDRVDFPIRLDKLDTSVSGINTSIQNIFGRFETIEKNLKDDFNSKISGLQDKLEKSQKTNLILLMFILLITGGSFLTILVKLVF